MSFWSSKGPDNQQKELVESTLSARDWASSAATSKRLSAQDKRAFASDLEVQRYGSSGSLAHRGSLFQSQFQLRSQNSTGPRPGLPNEMTLQAMHRALDSQRSREPPRYRALHEDDRRGNERFYGTRETLPQCGSQPFTAPTFTASREVSSWDTGHSRVRAFETTGKRNYDEMEIQLRHQKDLILRQTERIDALKSELTKRRRLRESADKYRRQIEGEDGSRFTRDGFDTRSHLFYQERQYREEILRRSQLPGSNSMICTAEYGLSPFPNAGNISIPLEHVEGERRRGFLDRSEEQIYSSSEETVTKRGDTHVLAGEIKMAQRVAEGKSPANQDMAPNEKAKAKPNHGGYLQLSCPADKAALSEYQCLIRESIELFEIQPEELLLGVQGRRNTIVEARQVGIRCRHCKHRPPHWRGQGAVYFPGSLRGVYQAAQNQAANHFLASCNEMPTALKEQLVAAREKQLKEARRSGGISYWVEACQSLGVEEQPGKKGLWFR